MPCLLLYRLVIAAALDPVALDDEHQIRFPAYSSAPPRAVSRLSKTFVLRQPQICGVTAQWVHAASSDLSAVFFPMTSQ
jgi:hypothetical protein